MDKADYINYWRESAEHDLASMYSIFQTGKYDWALFVGHLALEKVLKALWIKNNTQNFPPKIHNLKKLADEAKLEITEEQQILFVEVNEFNIEARYPDYKFQFFKKCTKQFTENYIKKISEIFTCIAEKT